MKALEMLPLPRPGGHRHKPQDVVAFWKASSGHWFDKHAGFDRTFRDRFLDLHMEAAARRHDDWMDTPSDGLALLILLDQFPRNAFRRTGHMYATDPLARHFAHQALAAGYSDQVEPDLRLFFCLPFAHSEDIGDQDISVKLNAELGQPWLEHAEGNRDIIRTSCPGRLPTVSGCPNSI
ncbi:DUF924 family protein [Rhizobium sp. RCC_161_2]|uniref:DUF924 family protein n=1 Tax=Rhizobium sp. RCC_161_2 TaxID=3239219 RepID=UPI00352448A0